MLEDLSSANPRVKYGAAEVLLAKARDDTASLCVHFDFFENLLNSDNSILKWSAIDILGCLARFEEGGRTERLKDRLFGFLCGGNLITANHAIFALSNMASAHPGYRQEITRELLTVEHFAFETEECRNMALGEVVLAIGSYHDPAQVDKSVVEFMQRQTRNARNATAAKARAFLKKNPRARVSTVRGQTLDSRLRGNDDASHHSSPRRCPTTHSAYRMVLELSLRVAQSMAHYHIWTIGCQMNKAESERLGSILEQRGYRPAATPEKADVIILNTCVVRGSAEDRAINKLHLLRVLKKQKPDATLAVTGCIVDSHAAELKKAFPHVDYFFEAGDFPQWIDDIRASELLPQRPGVSVYIPIMQGCNNFCSYCIVPYRRGRERSRLPGEIIAEAKELVGRGARELILLGQNVDSYGHDLPDQPDLADLLEELSGIDRLLRLRFLTNHPKDMGQKLIERVASSDKVCEHINLPVQSGDDHILEAMRRGYTAGQYRQLVADIRARIPGVALSTDVIVGFPSETEEQFRHTADLLASLRFDTVHVACYSPRAPTLAAKQLTDDVPPADKKRRLKVVEGLQQAVLTEINARLVGTTVEVLVEGKTRGKWRGRTRSDKLVFFEDPDNCLGRLVRVRLNRASPWSLQGVLD